MLRFLAEHDEDLGVADGQQATMAHLSAYFGHAEALALVLENAPKLRNARDGGGKTPQALARQRGDAAVLRVLEKAEREL